MVFHWEEKRRFNLLLEGLWSTWTNPDELPCVRNRGGQLPLAKVYINTKVCLEKYIGAEEFCGTDVWIAISETKDEGLLFPMESKTQLEAQEKVELENGEDHLDQVEPQEKQICLSTVQPLIGCLNKWLVGCTIQLEP